MKPLPPRLPVSAVAFDLDGTMLDTAGDIAAAVDATLVALGLLPLGPAVVRGLIGQGLLHLLQTALTLASPGIEPSPGLLAEGQVTFGRQYADGLHRTTTFYPGAREGLQALRTAGYPLACVTNKPARFTDPLLDAVGLAGYFAVVISGDTLPVKKPEPGQLLHAGMVLDVPPARLLMVGDSMHDLHAARAAGCPVYCVRYGYTEDPELLIRQADAGLDSLAEIVDRIVPAEPAPGFAPRSGSGPDSARVF
jgi:phosphoglycolate phosphatase